MLTDVAAVVALEVAGSSPVIHPNLQGFRKFGGYKAGTARLVALLTMALWLAWMPQAEAQTIVTGTASPPDATGAYTIALDLEGYMPVSVKKGSAWEEHYVYYLPPDLAIRRIPGAFFSP